jgi:uncharacterized Zn-finger protein
MGDDAEREGIEPAPATCRGIPGAPHAPIEITLAGGGAMTCPLCGRRFRRRRDSTIGPAAWPREE